MKVVRKSTHRIDCVTVSDHSTLGVVGYHQNLQLDEAEQPKITSPLDVIVKIGAAGVCRTDIHILEGQWAEKSGVKLPYTIGHENAGWIHELGDSVTGLKVGDPVILHPLVTCGLCRACRFGDDVHCEDNRFPGIDSDGGTNPSGLQVHRDNVLTQHRLRRVLEDHCPQCDQAGP
jgi:D-arabinose 1-dehydrogenase-like Zn-dependent alcohol dehydrogenase